MKKEVLSVAEKRNEIIEEQRKAREEFLRLKKMQQGEIETEARPSEVAIVPKTFGEKLKNFWYHYKAQTLVAAVLVIVIAVGTAHCLSREKYDFEVMYFAYTPVIDAQTDKMEEYFEKYATDINGDGEINVNVINCGVSDDDKDASRVTMLSKVQSIMSAEKTIVVYVVDQKAIKYFDNALGYSIFAEGPYALGEDFYKQTEISGIKPPEGLSVGLRIIEGTTFEGNEESEEAFEVAQKTLEKIKKQNS